MSADVKDFHDLEAEVQKQGICGRCGGCLAFCSAGEFNALSTGADGMPMMVCDSRCLHCGVCYLICPQTRSLDRELREKTGWKAPIGAQRRLLSARASSRRIRSLATDGGVVTALLSYALRRHLVQAAVVSRRVGPLSREPMVAMTTEDLIEAAGSHFEESHTVRTLGQRYTTFSPSAREVKSLGKRDLSRIALVGTPCQVFTIRKMQLLNVLPADSVVLVIGLFCMESFSVGAKAVRALQKKLSVSLGQIRKLAIKDEVIISTAGKDAIHVPFSVMDEFARPACLACPDFSNEFADISCGGLGSPEGYTTTILRTSAGETLYNRAREDRAIEELTYRTPGQRREAQTEMMARIVASTRRKQARAERTRGAAAC